MNYKYKTILLFSGGLDSFIAWHYLNYPPILFMNAGQSYIKKEIEVVKYFNKKYKKIKIHIDKSLNLTQWEEKNYYIPYRNILFSMIGSLYASKVYLIGIKGDSVDDNNSNATKLMSEFFINFNTNKKIIITSPFYQMSKSQIVRWYLEQKLSVQDLLKTRSCYNKNTRNQCGKCSSCFRRWVALENNNIKEKYDSYPWEWEEVKNYIKKMKAGLYDQKRTQETFYALKKYIKL